MEYASHRQPSQEWVKWLDQWVMELRVHGDTGNTIEHWWYIISQFARETNLPPAGVSSEAVLTWVGKGVGDSALRSRVNALRSFFRWAVVHGRIDSNPMDIIPAIKRRKKKQLPAPAEAVVKGLYHSDGRVRLLVRLFSDAGLRRNEAAIVRTDDLVGDLTGKSLVVHGKGDKDRVVPLTDRLVRDLECRPEGWVFPGGHGGHICNDTAYRLVKDATGWPPHAFRRRFATDVWRATGDVVKVQSLLGHESLATTQSYIYDTADDLRQAVKSMQTYRHQDGVRIVNPERILSAYGVPRALACQILDAVEQSPEDEYTQNSLF
ncbi:tyrosine-type recombinase/integrase [Bifidobacterium xylocopae]|uniref:Integrase n=1 Tax=Bifidobacterium xylocopae TaxID=2493119 RepID=A0A366KCE8_9BIFI|nr:tyrosine-type recombinase/integrase [Bifidobacterium xylocopae]RBP99037.1 integrase [Bifidobacterium xylocopae]